jgi:hypothetical protein
MTPKKTKKYALSIEILFNEKKSTTLRDLTRADVDKKIKEYLNNFIEVGVRFTVTEDWNTKFTY